MPSSQLVLLPAHPAPAEVTRLAGPSGTLRMASAKNRKARMEKLQSLWWGEGKRVEEKTE